MALDWDKPIEFENGEQCVLVSTRPEGWTQWGPRKSDGAYPTREIHRLGVDESTMAGAISARWFVFEDGRASGFGAEHGYHIVNKK